MSYCINPNCSKRKNNEFSLECATCGNPLVFYGKGRYRLIKPLCEELNSFHAYEVFEARDLRRDELKVIKILKRDSKLLQARFEQESNILQQLKHPGLPVGYKKFSIQLKDSSTVHCIVMEKIYGLNLDEWVKKHGKINEVRAISWMLQMVDILDQLHKRNLFHRDIKPSNIMIKPSGQLILIDFGEAREVTPTIVEGRQSTTVCSAGYTPREQIEGLSVPQSDFFSLGRTFVYLLTGISPYELIKNDENKLNWRDKAPQIISKRLPSLIDYLMEPNFKKRPKNTQEILQRIKEIRYRSTPKSILIGASFALGILIGVLIGATGMFVYLKNEELGQQENNNTISPN